MRANILAQALGPRTGLGTVADLDLPHDFLVRLVDRVLRSSFYERFRAVGGDARGASDLTPAAGDRGTDAGVRVEHFVLPPDADSGWRGLAQSHPAVASFRSPQTDGPDAAARRLTGTGEVTDAIRRDIRRRLVRESLLPALAHAIVALGPERVLPPHADGLDVLADAGIPVDLLAYVRATWMPEGATPGEVAAMLAARLAESNPAPIDRVLKTLRKSAFTARPSLPHFRPTPDSGCGSVALVRAQATRAARYAAPGDGSNVDLLATTLGALPETPGLVGAQNEYADALARVPFGTARGAPTTVLAQGLNFSQWAGDNAKPGMLDGAPAHLLPRFASRREYREEFVPGDDLAPCALGTHVRSERSPLLFQGGNLLLVNDRAGGKRVLLVGEGEVQRNRALGLTAEQALEFLRVEMDADDAEVLPAASYHIDQELCVRSTPERTIAFVPDVGAACIAIVECAAGALAGASRWPRALVDEAIGHIRAGRSREGLALIWGVLGPERRSDQLWPVSLADALSTGAADSGVGNLHRFLLALDHLGAAAFAPSDVPDPALGALFRSFRRRDADRARIRALLNRRGWSVVSVPAVPEESRGINPLNGLHLPERYFMPAYGGLFAPLDRLAEGAFRATLGPAVQVVPIPTAESQRREGALHCSVAVFGH